MRRRAMIHRSSSAILIASAAMFFWFSGIGTAALAHRVHRFEFRVSTSVRTIELPGRAKNWDLMLVTVNRNAGYLYTDGSGRLIRLYGHGVMLRLVQRGRMAFITGVAINGRPRIVVTYRLD